MSGPGRTKQILDLCDQALLIAPEHRERFIAQECRLDNELKHAVQSLLQAITDSGNFLVLDDPHDNDESEK